MLIIHSWDIFHLKLTKPFNTRKNEILCLISKFLSVNLLLDIAWHYRINLTRFDYGVNLSVFAPEEIYNTAEMIWVRTHEGKYECNIEQGI